jgi:exosortase family protein XrtF
LKSYFVKYRPFLLFLGKFIGTYVALIILYQIYLNQFDEKTFEPDGLTTLVAEHATSVLKWLDYNASMVRHKNEASYVMFIGGDSLVRIIEGCNAVSVIILFISFVVAFSGKLSRTLLFIGTGILLVHILNVLRIVALMLGLLHYPEYESLMHDIIFPLFIYGVVFGLWVIWINKFSFYAENTAK